MWIDFIIRVVYYSLICFEATEYGSTNKSFRRATLCYTGSLMALEAYQCYSVEWRNYITDGWNVLDVFGQVLYVIYAVYDLQRKENKAEFYYGIECLMIFSLIFLLARGVALLRIFPQTRYLIRMIIIVIKDMFSFMII